MTERVRVDAPAKVNLRLRVLGREQSGFHSLETIFCAISLADRVELCSGPPGVRLAVHGGIDTGPPVRNLAVRAARAFSEAIGAPAAVRIELHKRIPAAAGLGGGSSDAAAVLRGLNRLHGEPLTAAELLRVGAGLGADVPFFLCGSALALGWGRGERLLALPALPPRPILIAHPGVALPTADVFRAYAERPGATSAAAGWSTALADLRDWQGVAAMADNDLLGPAAARLPEMHRILELLRRGGAAPALLSGSGAAVFGVFAEDEELNAATDAVRRAGWRVWAARTLSAPPVPRLDPPSPAP